MKLYVKNDCPACESLNVPVDLSIEKIYIDSEEYNGFIPQQTPILQIGVHNIIAGNDNIEFLLNLLVQAQNGHFKQP